MILGLGYHLRLQEWLQKPYPDLVCNSPNSSKKVFISNVGILIPVNWKHNNLRQVETKQRLACDHI